VWGEAARMRDRSESLRSRVRKFVGSLVVEATNSKMVPLGADADQLDGLNPHIVIVDELHAHRTRAVLDVMDSALGGSRCSWSSRRPAAIEPRSVSSSIRTASAC
jgi:phage terminase large subunit-like protein